MTWGQRKKILGHEFNLKGFKKFSYSLKKAYFHLQCKPWQLWYSAYPFVKLGHSTFVGIKTKTSESAGCQSWYLIEIYFWAIKWFMFCLFYTFWAYLPFSRKKPFIFAWKMRGIIFVKIFIVNICKGNTFPMQK